jgi:hypothetical protein
MPDILRVIIDNIEDDAYLQIIPSLFRRLAAFPNLTEEGKIAYIYQDEIKRMIINRLREEGVVSKSELMVWLKDKYQEGFIDLESVLGDLIKWEIIKQGSIKELASELIFLINDILITRVPPASLLKQSKSKGLPPYLSEVYLKEVKNYFQEYRPTEEDTIKIVDLIIDPQIYETLKLLRTTIATKNELEKLKKKGVEDTNLVLKKLWKSNMITVLQDKSGKEYYALLTDIYLDIIFPKYLLKIIKDGYDQKSKGNKVLIEYLNLLKDAYTDLKSREK